MTTQGFIGRRFGRLFCSCALAVAASAGLQAQPAEAPPQPIALPNPGFEEGRVGEAPPSWHGAIRVGGPPAGATDFVARIDDADPREGQASVRLERVAATDDEQFGTVTGSVEAAPYRGKRVRLTAAIRAEAAPDAHVGLWLRIDREQRRPGFFDNMGNRPIRSRSWADYRIEADVAADAERLVFGLLLAGGGRAWMDDVRLEVIGPARSAGTGVAPIGRPRTAPAEGDEPARPLSARGLDNLAAFADLYGILRYFHPSDEAAAADWDRLALLGVEHVEAARSPAELAAALRSLFAPLAPSVDIFVDGRAPRARDATRPPHPGAVALRWRHQGIGEDPAPNVYRSDRVEVTEVAADDLYEADLPGGVTARVPLALWRNAEGRTLPAAAAGSLPASRKPAGFVPSGFDRATRLAAVVEAWSTLHHSYPYFDVVRVDWPAQLRETLRAAALDADDLAFHRTLRRMVASLEDGHGHVVYANPADGMLPIAVDEVEGRVVVTAVGEGVEGLARGDAITHVGGRPVGELVGELAALTSGSRQWIRYRALGEALTGPAGTSVELRVAGADGAGRTVTLPYLEVGREGRVREPRPEPIAELRPGIFYVDLDRVTDEMMAAREADLAAARGLVFDMRGYPRGSPGYLGRLLRRPGRSAQFKAPIYTRPDRRGLEYRDGAWQIQPQAPAFTSNIAFIAAGSAISYAESVLGVVRGERLGDIVGEASAGANGNVNFAMLPGGYRVMWTGMRVVNQDGSRHHLLGVQPTVPVSRTLAGVRAGRDEMLDRALALVAGRADRRTAD